MKETLISVIKTLVGLFEDKAELRGFNDWSKFVGCMNALADIVESIPDQTQKESEVNDNGR